MAEGERGRGGDRGLSERTVYEPRVALRRIRSALLALGAITVAGVLGYMVFERWSFTDALYMTVITLTTVGYREVRTLDATGQLWTMALLITGAGTLFYAAVSSVELVVEAAIDRLQGHYILCGYGRVGRQVAREFASDGVPLGELRIGERTGAMILAVRSEEGGFDITPSAGDRLRAGDTLIVLGTREQITRLEGLMRGE